MADFYITMGDTETSKKYMKMARRSKKLDDTILRLEAKMHRAAGDPGSAVKKLMLIKEFGESDLDLFGNMILDMNISEFKDSQEVIDFYNKTVSRIGKYNKDYIRLANILYDNDRKDEALKYYEIAHKKGERNEWAMYRIGILAGPIEGRMKTSEEMFSHLQKGDSILSQMAKTKLMEIDISNRIAEVF
jgi:tetratricopeptide (TPR) repeat protein